MAAQKRKKKTKKTAEFFCIFECLLPQNESNESSLLPWFFQIMWKTIKKPKSRVCLKVISKLACIKFSKKYPVFGGMERQTKDLKARLKFFSYALLPMNSI